MEDNERGNKTTKSEKQKNSPETNGIRSKFEAPKAGLWYVLTAYVLAPF